MVTPLRVREQQQIRSISTRTFDRLWATRPSGDAIRLRDFLLATLPQIIQAFADVAAASAADYFETETTLPARLAPIPAAASLDSGIRAAIKPLFGGAGESAAGRMLRQLTDFQVLQAGDQTIFDSAESNAIRFAWVPTGPKTCEYCTLKASRGAVYWSADAASLNTIGRHGNCDCTAEPVRDDRDLTRLRQTRNYRPDVAKAEYDRAVQQIGSTDINKVVSQMRLNRLDQTAA